MNVENVELDMPVNDTDGLWKMTQEISCAARSNLCVLLTGPPEAAQDIAYRIHSASGWRHGEFLVVDCGRSDALLHRLFGLPLAGDRPTSGGTPELRLMQAGSVFLDEVGRLSLNAQERLADYLSAMRRDRHGRSRWRLIASTSEQLFDRVNAGTFSDRLFYRLNMIHLSLSDTPPSAVPGATKKM
jgi:DNA-binding NtrC family response regulator